MTLHPAHPRSRGEHGGRHLTRRGARGSSPLARGTQEAQKEAGHPHRLIPARAGNTCKASSARRFSAAHPRSRGEHLPLPLQPQPAPGSSPLARGTLTLSASVMSALRLIPARAGNTWNVATKAWVNTAHPRSRGEHSFLSRIFGYSRGSSPLARGTPPMDCLARG